MTEARFIIAKALESTSPPRGVIQQADAILAALKEAGLVLEQDWQPIETAPRDGSIMQICAPHWKLPFIAAYRPKDEKHYRDVKAREMGRRPDFILKKGWFLAHPHNAGGYGVGNDLPDIAAYRPTHWRALPAPPATTGGSHDD